MNCKPGDLAIVVRCDPVPEAVGCLVECLVLHAEECVSGDWFINVWEVRWGDNDARLMHGTRGWACPDAWLRPIRNPGEDEQDETLSWLPVPFPEIA